MDFRTLVPHDPGGLHYAVRILVGTTVVWLVLRWVGDVNPVWAVISLIMVTEPQTASTWKALLARLANTVIGCGTGLLFLLVAGPENWVVPLALTATVLICTYLIRVPLTWRVGPVTAALVLTTGVVEKSRESGLETAGLRVGEVLLGALSPWPSPGWSRWPGGRGTPPKKGSRKRTKEGQHRGRPR
jgi:uncharacterized membrane protein YgaE (UPF0421/DUF939 family)